MPLFPTRRWLTAGLTTGLTVMALTLAGPAQAARSMITISTGDVTGIYFQAGGSICSLVNAGRKEHQIRCTVASSPGSVDNIRALRRGERAFGFAQSDLVQQAWRGTGAFAETGPFRGLRTVFAVNPETLTLVASDNVDIGNIQDLRGTRINLGPRGSGQAASMKSLMDALGWTEDDFADAAHLDGSAQVEAFCNGNLDIAVFVTGHPNSAVQETLSCGGTMIPVEGPAINRLVRAAPYYNTTVIPAGAYRGVSTDVPSYGVTSLLISSTNTSQRVVRDVTQAVFEHPDQFRDWHPAFKDLKPAGMARGTSAVDAPLHPGARAYFQDQDLL